MDAETMKMWNDNVQVPDDEPVATILSDETPFTIPKGKYKGLTLQRMVGVKPSQYEKVLALKAEIISDPEFQQYASSISRTYAQVRRERDQITKDLSEANLRLAAVTMLMIAQLEAEGETGVSLTNGDTVRVQYEPHLIVTDKEEFRQWCLKEGLESQMVLPWGTANSLTKNMALEGEEHPPGADCYARPKVVFTKGDK